MASRKPKTSSKAIVKEGITEEEAERIKAALEGVGATVALKQS